MGIARAIAHLVVASAAAAGAFTVAVQLGHGSPSTDVVTAASATQSATSSATSSATNSAATGPSAARAAGDTRPARRTTDAQQALTEAAQAASSGSRAPSVVGGGVEVVDETKPHAHVVDPQTGGLVSVAPAKGLVKDAQDLGPVHVDPLPAGVDLSDPTDTATLLQRAGTVQAELAAGRKPVTTGATAPVGTPGVPTLAAHVAPSCTGTGSDGRRVQVLYVHEASTASRYDAVLPVIRNEVANVDDVFAVSSEQTGGGRRVRWVHDADCQPVVTDVTVPDGALGPDFWGTVDALKTLGFDDPSRKYLTFADANQFCGIGTLYDDTRVSDNYNDGYAASYARVDANCWSTAQSVPAHELTHNLGGVQSKAPHATANGHCWDDADLMCYDDGSGVPMQQVCAAAQEDLLDCNHDDYFNTDPAPGTFLAENWNTASSSFLDVVPILSTPPTVTLEAATATAQTGDSVRFTAAASRPVTWVWSVSSGCAVTPASDGFADVVCPATATGTVGVTATGTDASGSTGAASANVTLTRAAAPVARVAAPASATTGPAFGVSGSATGKSPYTYGWKAGTCVVGDATAVAPSITCPAGAASQWLPVEVTVTQADGQTAKTTVYVGLSGATGAPAPRAATTWSTPKAAKGLVSATLGAGKNVTVASAAVTVQVMGSGTTTWVDLETTTTDAKGVASTDPSATAAAGYRFVFAGDATRAGGTSPEVAVRVSNGGR